VIRNWWKRAPKKVKIRGTKTTFGGLEAYRKFVNGEITLEEFSKDKCETVTEEFEDEITVYNE